MSCAVCERDIGGEISGGADTGYDTLYVYKDAIEPTQSFDTNLLQKALLSTNRTGVSGTIRFDSQG